MSDLMSGHSPSRFVTRNKLQVALAGTSIAVLAALGASLTAFAQGTGPPTATTLPPRLPAAASPNAVSGITSPVTTATPTVPAGQTPNLTPTGVGASSTSPPLVLTHQPPPSVSLPSATCANDDLSAALTSGGPYTGGGNIQFIITITSKVACQLSGYPVLNFTSSTGSPTQVTVENGGTVGNADAVSPVAVGPGAVASFLLQFFVSASTCVSVPTLGVGLPGTTPTVTVSLAPPIAYTWYACSVVNVSPFEQGNTLGRYA